MSNSRWKMGAAHLVLLSALLGAAPATAGKLSVLYQATSDDGGGASSLYQPLPVAGGGIIVEAAGGTGSYGLVLLLTPNGPGQPYTRTVLHDFTDTGSSDGAFPSGHLVADKTGNVWGMTNSSVGAPGGTLFELVNPGSGGGSWTYKQVLQMPASYQQSFNGTGYDDMVISPNGDLYGLLRAVCSGQGCGITFDVPAAALAGKNTKVNTLFTVPGSPTGLARDPSGNLFGVEYNGGSAGLGAIWEVSPPATKGGSWTGGIIYNFCAVTDQYGDCPDGANPDGAPAIDKNGTLYGTSYRDGAGPQSGTGTIWSMQPGGGVAVIHELYSYYNGGGTTPDFDITDPEGDTLLSRQGQVITEVLEGGAVGKGTTILRGGVISVSPVNQTDLQLTKKFAATGVQAGPVALNSSLSMDSKGNLYGTSDTYYDPSNSSNVYPVIFEITN